MKKIVFVIFLAALIVPIFSFAQTTQLNLNLQYPTFGGIDLNAGVNVNVVIAWLYYFFVGIAALAAFVMLVWGGIQWLTSGAIPSQASEARDKLRAAILGLLLVLASFLIIQVINPQLTILNQPGVGTAFGIVPAFNAPSGSSGGSGGSGSGCFSGTSVDLVAKDSADTSCGTNGPFVHNDTTPTGGDFPSDIMVLEWASPSTAATCSVTFAGVGWAAGPIATSGSQAIPWNGTYTNGQVENYTIECQDSGGAVIGTDSISVQILTP